MVDLCATLIGNLRGQTARLAVIKSKWLKPLAYYVKFLIFFYRDIPVQGPSMSGIVARVRAFSCKLTLFYTNSVCAVAHATNLLMGEPCGLLVSATTQAPR